MVTCRELIDELSRIFTTCLSWVLALPVFLFLALRLLTADQFWPVALFNNLAVCCFLPLLCLVPLGLVTRAKRGLLLAAPLAVIGLGWFGPLLGSKSPQAAVNPTVKVATFNMYRSNQEFTTVDNWLRETNADLVFLQEVPSQYLWLVLQNFTRQYPYFGTHVVSEWGNVFLSRYPILSHEDLNLTSSGVPDIQQRFLLDIGGQSIAAYNVYFAPPEGRSHFIDLEFGSFLGDYVVGYDETERNHELQRLMERVTGENVPYIMAGDFNLSEQSISYDRLAAQMGDTFREAGDGFGATWPVRDIFPGFMPPLLRVDYIWHSPDFRAGTALRGEDLGSDHLPVIAELELTAPPG
jgi:endonuclease/exonuclease/phosphatase family metal-dependent hydrolase